MYLALYDEVFEFTNSLFKFIYNISLFIKLCSHTNTILPRIQVLMLKGASSVGISIEWTCEGHV